MEMNVFKKDSDHISVVTGTEEYCAGVVKMLREKGIEAFITYHTRQGRRIPYTFCCVCVHRDQKSAAEMEMKKLHIAENENVEKYDRQVKAQLIGMLLLGIVLGAVGFLFLRDVGGAVVVGMLGTLLICLVKAGLRSLRGSNEEKGR